jgi:hypothetical protein
MQQIGQFDDPQAQQDNKPWVLKMPPDLEDGFHMSRQVSQFNHEIFTLGDPCKTCSVGAVPRNLCWKTKYFRPQAGRYTLPNGGFAEVSLEIVLPASHRKTGRAAGKGASSSANANSNPMPVESQIQIPFRPRSLHGRGLRFKGTIATHRFKLLAYSASSRSP